MGKIKNWLKNQIAAMSIAFSNVEKNVFGQEGLKLSEGSRQERRHNQGTLADSLLHGEVSQEVRNLRWRMYKVMKASKNISVDYSNGTKDENNNINYNVIRRSPRLDKVKIDQADDFPLEMVVSNEALTIDVVDVMHSVQNPYDTVVKNIDDNGVVSGATHGEISGDDYIALNKQDKPIIIVRDLLPKFKIEKYAKKLNIRTIDENNKLLEFYVSKYPDEYNRNSNVFINEIKKAMANGPANINTLDIKEVEFISLNTIGVSDYLLFRYKIVSFDKVVEFNGHYVVKFKAETLTNGEDILTDYVEEDLEKKYLNKEARTTNR